MANGLVAKIKNAGIIGAGGAGFPTYAKVDTTVEYVIANCAECEPLVKSDKYLMEHYANEIVKGLAAVKEHTQAKEGVLAIKAKNKHAVEALEDACSKSTGIRVYLLDDYYPAGDEQQIIYEVTGRVIEVGKLPSSVGCIVLNAQTLYQISASVIDEPVTWRMVTVAGAVEKSITARVPIGTPVPMLIDLAGGASTPDAKVVLGGPLMGRISEDPSKEFVTKTTNGIIVLPSEHELIQKKSADLATQYRIAKSACCQCTYCTLMCPRNNIGLGVKPSAVMQGLTINNGDVLDNGNVALGCCNCGLCTYMACNMGLTPHRFIQELRSKLLANKTKWTGSLAPVNENRDYSKIPSKRVIQRVGLSQYDNGAELLSDPVSPKRVRISLRQHIGAPSVAAVNVGDKVTVGQMIADAAPDALSVPVHASINGSVSDVTSDFIEITGM